MCSLYRVVYSFHPGHNYEPKQKKTASHRCTCILLLIPPHWESPGTFCVEGKRRTHPPRTRTYRKAQCTPPTAGTRWNENIDTDTRIHVRPAVYLLVPVSRESERSMYTGTDPLTNQDLPPRRSSSLWRSCTFQIHSSPKMVPHSPQLKRSVSSSSECGQTGTSMTSYKISTGLWLQSPRL